MNYLCSVCERSFAEPGFCPFDGTRLAESNADAPTVTSAQVRAPSDADTQMVIKDEDTTSQVRSVSAAVNAAGRADAMDTIRRRVSEYDRLIGETLDGRYKVLRKLGEGGMGVVFAVKHTVIERPLAIKVLKRDVMRDQGTVKRFIQEARAASRIGHPNIVDVTDFGSTADGMTYQVMEMIDGTTLKAAIKDDAPLPPERVIRIGSQIARALVAAHSKGIVHRDLKPENVFLTEREGRPDFVKIVDFGIAKVQPIEGTKVDGPRLTRAGAVFGTPEYMAPEQAAGRNDTDHRVDVYALGTILYEMLVGKTPHKGDSTIRTIAMQMLDPITPPSKVNPDLDIPADLERVVMRALAKKREERYQSMADLQSALDGISLESHTIPDTAPPMPVRATPLPSAVPTPIPGASSTPGDSAPRRAKPSTRQLHEPQFVGTPGQPVSFSHVYDDEPADMERSSKWPMVIAGLLMLLLGAGGTVFLIMKLSTPDKVVTAPVPDDAAVAELRDAGVDDAPDDAEVVVDVPLDAGTKATVKATRDASIGVRPGDRKGNITIEVLTRPAEADVFIGRNYRGPSGTKITDKYGAKVRIECKTAFMKGHVEVIFDGERTSIMCTATRDRFCVPGLKNPYDDCEEDPNATGP